jgi:hypothetical protein
MKKYILFLFTAVMALTFVPQNANAATTPAVKTTDGTLSQLLLANRLDEINATDQSAMTRDEKKALQTEKRSVQGEMQNGSGGVYISVGALLLIILILIILL